ncbi:hypothetical protein [Parasphingorhabdus sp.]|uniref:hypothetical protein n=1 Tax=Parasphingorhabdus sp. TaxID=2709688 RepID=UPI003A92417C
MTFDDYSNIDDSPMATLDEVAGTNVSNRLIEAFGGQRIYIVQKITPGCKLVEVLGLDDATPVVEALGGESIDVPLGISSNTAKAHETIKLLHLAGNLVREISKVVNYSERSVYRILKEMRERGEIPQKS